MRKFRERRPSPAMGVAFLALLVALSGTALALPGKNSVKKNDIAKNAVAKRAIAPGGVGKSEAGSRSVGRSELRDDTVQSDKVADDSLTGADIAEGTLGQVPSAATADSATTANTANSANTAGSAPPSGPAAGDLAGTYPNPTLGANSVTTGKLANGQVRAADLGPIVTRSTTTAVPAGSSALEAVTCPSAEVRIGGGAFFVAPIAANKGIQASFAAGTNTWVAVGRNNTAAEQTLTVQALCLQ